MLLAIPHMFSMGSVFLPGTMQRVYWATLLLAVGACLLGYRVLTPLYRSWRHQLRLVETVRLAPDLLHLEFAGRDLDKLEARGGQYFTWRLLTPQLWRQAHPFSLSAAPTNNRLRITIRITGDGTAELAAAKPGTRVMFAGPYGAFTDASRTRDGLVLIGAGTGVAPIRSLLETTTAHPADRGDPPRLPARGPAPAQRVPGAVLQPWHRAAPDGRAAVRGTLGERQLRTP